ncbi:MAG TPA: AraC family transcriptional regulator [Planctomycetota bacterium]|nr:AraC family transcriptional regulator [Planctomycetota bacterium]
MPHAPPGLIPYVFRHMTVTFSHGSRQQFETGYTLERRTLTTCNFIYITRGRVIWVVDGKDNVLTPGSLIVVPPGHPHSGYSTTKRMTLASFHFHATLPGGVDVFELLRPPLLRQVKLGGNLDRLLRAGNDEYLRSPDENRITLPHYGTLIVQELIWHDARAGLLDCRVRPVGVKGGDDAGLVLGILKELDERLDRPISLDELAKRAGFSAQHLNRVFRRTLGVTPLQYLQQARMEHAAKLLAGGDLTIKAIAAQSGFDDPYYFSRVFHEHFGVSPTEYRNTAGSDSPSPGSAAPFR